MTEADRDIEAVGTCCPIWEGVVGEHPLPVGSQVRQDTYTSTLAAARRDTGRSDYYL
jgi:hypothetical protein